MRTGDALGGASEDVGVLGADRADIAVVRPRPARAVDEVLDTGFKPNKPKTKVPSTTVYKPWEFETPVIGNPLKRVTMWYRFTRGGLKGLDFGGKEINTGQYD